MARRKNGFVSASELARIAYCERQVAFDAAHGRRSTKAQDRARERGLKAHAAFYEEGRRIADASATKGRCLIATLALGDSDETRALRAFRDLYLRRSAGGRWFIGTYYRLSPAVCGWLRRSPMALKAVRWLLKTLARVAGAIIRRRLG